MLEWLKGKVTRGGSKIIVPPSEPKDLYGFSDDVDESLIREREQVYEELFGPFGPVSHELLPMVPHIDVYTFEPGYQGRDFYTLVSSGMSDLPMHLPDGVSQEYARAEIVLYVDEPKELYINLIRHFARYPHSYDTYFSYEHTIPNGDPAEPFFADSELTSIMFIGPILSPDKSFTERLKGRTGIEVQLLHMTFLTTRECDFKLEDGADMVYDMLDEHEHHFVVDESRRSYI